MTSEPHVGPADRTDEDVVLSLASRLEEFADSLDARERLLLHRMIWLHLNPVERVRFSALSEVLSPEEETLVATLEQEIDR